MSGAFGRGWRRFREAPLWARLCLVIGVVIALVSGAVVAGSLLLSAYAQNSVPQEALLPNDLRAQGRSIDGPLNILLLGMDQRANSEDEIRSDSVIIVHINAAHDQAYLVSLPRDGRVEVPPYPATDYRGGITKLTDAFADGNRMRKPGGGWIGDPSAAGRQRGVELLARTIDKLVPGGLKFNAVAIINFHGFEAVVQALGGIRLCVDERTVSDHYDATGKYVGVTLEKGIPGYVYERGCQDMQAWQALDYVRQRKHLELNDGDYGRQRHQQQFLYAVFKKLLSTETLTDIRKVSALRDAAGGLLTVDLGGVSLLDWLFSMRSLGTSDVTLIKTNAGQYASVKQDGQDFEEITPDTLKLLTAVSTDRVADFLVEHPAWIAKPEG
jgi:polyisoprenyl-teichoic acid--peptidoglycan teichoic acid transferase